MAFIFAQNVAMLHKLISKGVNDLCYLNEVAKTPIASAIAVVVQ